MEKWISIPTFYHRPSNLTISFVPIANVPGYTHRVCINHIPGGWLSNTHRPSQRTAQFFAEKLGEHHV